MREFIKKIFIGDTDDGIIQFIRYFIVGGIAAVVNIGLLFLLVDIFDINYILSNIIGFIFALLVNYGLSTMFVFTNDNPPTNNTKAPIQIAPFISSSSFKKDISLITPTINILTAHKTIGAKKGDVL